MPPAGYYRATPTPQVKSALWKAIPTVVFALAVSIQLFGPHPIGKGDNGDFPKVLGPIGVWVAPEFQPDLYGYFITEYRIDDKHIWKPDMPSTEVMIAAVARKICELVLLPGHFDLRVLGALHAMLATLAFWLCLLPLAQWPWPTRTLFTALFLVVFADPQYVQFFSTAYMDTAALVFLMLVFAVAWNTVLGSTNRYWPLWFCLFGCLFLGAKMQHQLCVIPLCFFCLAIASQSREWTWLVPPIALLATTSFMVQRTYQGYRVEPLFSAIFFKLLPLSQGPDLTLHELNRPATDAAYNHSHAYSQGSPLTNATYRTNFQQDVTTGRVLAYYAHHPNIAFTVLRADLVAYAPDLPMASFGTMRRTDDPKPVFRPQGPQIWSTLRRESAQRWPWHIPILYLLAPLIIPGRARFLALTISTIGALSFAAGSLLDATETSRHIILYQETTDLLYILALSQAFEMRGSEAELAV
jgi:hypothetical protein